MSNSAIIMLPISMHAYETMKFLKENENIKSMSDNDFIMQLLNDYCEDMVSDTSNGNSTSDFDENKLTPDPLDFKKETDIVKYNSDFQTKDTNIVDSKIECKDCNKKFSTNSELLKHYEIEHKDPNQYKCSCGENFECLQLFLQHKFICSNVNIEIKLEPTTVNKRNSVDVNDENVKRNKISELCCETCNRKFRTSSSLYLHQCRKKSISNNKDEIKTPDQIVLVKPPVKFTCHCSAEFSDYYEYSNHCDQCGKPVLSEITSPYNIDKRSPLRILPNDEGKFDCTDCNKSFSSILSLRQHRDGMHRDKPKYICKTCGKGYRWCTSFHYHKKKCDLEK